VCGGVRCLLLLLLLLFGFGFGFWVGGGIVSKSELVQEWDGLSIDGLVQIRKDARGGYYALCPFGLIKFQTKAGRAWIVSELEKKQQEIDLENFSDVEDGGDGGDGFGFFGMSG